LQLLFDTSEEAPPVDGVEVKGLSVIPGTVKRFPGARFLRLAGIRQALRIVQNYSRVLARTVFFIIYTRIMLLRRKRECARRRPIII
jgi:hypothetical protein